MLDSSVDVAPLLEDLVRLNAKPPGGPLVRKGSNGRSLPAASPTDGDRTSANEAVLLYLMMGDCLPLPIVC